MISSAPAHAAEHWSDLARRVQSFLQVAEQAARNGITWAEFGELLMALLRLSIQAADTLSGMTGKEKKEMVLAAVAALFDAVADKAVPAYLYPLWLLSRSAVRSLVLALASGAVEILLPMVRSGR
jgi:hypothetical protein